VRQCASQVALLSLRGNYIGLDEEAEEAIRDYATASIFTVVAALEAYANELYFSLSHRFETITVPL
jgi:hypothetical protein